MDAVEVEEHQVPSGSGDTSHNQSESSIQQSASGTSTSDTSTIQSPSREIQESKNTELRASTSGSSSNINNTQSSVIPSVGQPSSTSQINTSNLNQKTAPGNVTTSAADVEFGMSKSEEKKADNPDRR